MSEVIKSLCVLVAAGVLVFVLLAFLPGWQPRRCELQFADGTSAVDFNCESSYGTTRCVGGEYRSFKSMRCVRVAEQRQEAESNE